MQDLRDLDHALSKVPPPERRALGVSLISGLPSYQAYYPLVNVSITMENHHAINGTTPLSMVLSCFVFFFWEKTIGTPENILGDPLYMEPVMRNRMYT